MSALAAALILIRDPDVIDSAFKPTVLMGLFRLTRAEARLAGLLASRQEPEVALGTGTLLNTIRTHAKSVMAKTGTSRQGELVALVLRNVIITA